MLFASFLDSVNNFLDVISPYVVFGLIVILIIILIVISAIPNGKLTSREIAIAATAIAASIALNQIKVKLGANGGSVSAASIVPLALYCYIFGVRKGIFAAFIYSVLKVLLGGSIAGFTQALLDYILPYTAFGLISAIKPLSKATKGYDIIVGLFLVYTIRLICHTLAGVFFWQTPLLGSIAYNLPYLALDFLIAATALFFIIYGKHMPTLIKFLKPTQSTNSSNNQEQI